ncbi:MAG: nucleoside triphosphate pyrophosphohydrolase [Actinomycetota bacterium]|nr:nucleoside triphosphate pyrophosphohydrolase [Actinomycetota bacterium]MCL6093892.1 nucleoside triphosphate pyrophosphohydrolase [Actinomycetota bacterium]MDA8166255.1 nucleoside triphosphate pyrophosphohydrolase [Actinomycetota bacterium]
MTDTVAAPDGQPLAQVLLELDELVRTLRRECPWDREQGVDDIVTHTLEETYELIDAAHAGRGDELTGELGDLLFHIFFLSHLAEERGWGDLTQVTRGIIDKLVRRHPHVFADASAATAADVVERWERIKRDREGRRGIFHDVPSSLPATLYAQRLQLRAAAVGFDWVRAEPVFDKLAEEIGELTEALAAEPPEKEGTDKKRGPETAAYHEIGDVLFAVVNLSRKLRIDPELALRSAAGRFQKRVETAAALARAGGEDFSGLSLARQEEYYQRAKATEA